MFTLRDYRITFPMNCMVRANFNAGTATNTAVHTENELFLFRYRFGIMTPSTTERTAFEKNCSPDAGSIIDGKALNIENNT
jgi:hypothetical protein